MKNSDNPLSKLIRDPLNWTALIKQPVMTALALIAVLTLSSCNDSDDTPVIEVEDIVTVDEEVTELPETYREIDGNLTARWIWGGAEQDTLDEIFERIETASGARSTPEQWDTIIEYGTGHWTYEFISAGNEEVARGVLAENQGEDDAAFDAFYKASTYYQIGKFPFLRTDDYPYFLDAYERSMAAYERAGAYFPVPLEVIEIPYEGGTVRGYLHLIPESLETPSPLVILSGGIDTFKVEHYMLIEELNAAGMSALVADLPGIGESNYVTVTPSHDEVYSLLLDEISNDWRIDIDKVGLWASSWGGNAAARTAFTDPRFSAIAAVCGPVHEALNLVEAIELAPTQVVAQFPTVLVDVAADRMGLTTPLQEEDITEFGEIMQTFSLVEQGLVGGETKATVPVLAINTPDDPIAPPADMEALIDSVETGEVFYIDASGHCGTRDLILEKSVPWLASYLVEN